MSAQTSSNGEHRHGLKNPPKEVVLRIRRRERQDAAAYWDEFAIPYRPNLNIISCLMEIRKNPVTRDGRRVTPPVWEMNCLEQVCGICTMVING
ncbi:MAG: succinate dehydrogenase iron-sulfur subunit, partial [Acidobacteria bacterium]